MLLERNDLIRRDFRSSSVMETKEDFFKIRLEVFSGAPQRERQSTSLNFQLRDGNAPLR